LQLAKLLKKIGHLNLFLEIFCARIATHLVEVVADESVQMIRFLIFTLAKRQISLDSVINIQLVLHVIKLNLQSVASAVFLLQLARGSVVQNAPINHQPNVVTYYLCLLYSLGNEYQ